MDSWEVEFVVLSGNAVDHQSPPPASVLVFTSSYIELGPHALFFLLYACEILLWGMRACV